MQQQYRAAANAIDRKGIVDERVLAASMRLAQLKIQRQHLQELPPRGSDGPVTGSRAQREHAAAARGTSAVVQQEEQQQHGVPLSVVAVQQPQAEEGAQPDYSVSRQQQQQRQQLQAQGASGPMLKPWATTPLLPKPCIITPLVIEPLVTEPNLALDDTCACGVNTHHQLAAALQAAADQQALELEPTGASPASDSQNPAAVTAAAAAAACVIVPASVTQEQLASGTAVELHRKDAHLGSGMASDAAAIPDTQLLPGWEAPPESPAGHCSPGYAAHHSSSQGYDTAGRDSGYETCKAGAFGLQHHFIPAQPVSAVSNRSTVLCSPFAAASQVPLAESEPLVGSRDSSMQSMAMGVAHSPGHSTVSTSAVPTRAEGPVLVQHSSEHKPEPVPDSRELVLPPAVHHHPRECRAVAPTALPRANQKEKPARESKDEGSVLWSIGVLLLAMWLYSWVIHGA